MAMPLPIVLISRLARKYKTMVARSQINDAPEHDRTDDDESGALKIFPAPHVDQQQHRDRDTETDQPRPHQPAASRHLLADGPWIIWNDQVGNRIGAHEITG